MKNTLHVCNLLILIFCLGNISYAQPLNHKKVFTHQDTLRGSITPERAWWNVLRYDIAVTPDYLSKTITGSTTITFKVIAKNDKRMQIDLMHPLVIDSFYIDGDRNEEDDGMISDNSNNFHFFKTPAYTNGSVHTITIFYHGKPREAIRPPWDGGWIWKKDEMGRPWMSVACQGLGASVWYPCKDHQSDEPDNGASLSITAPDTLVAVGNGRLIGKKPCPNNSLTWTWEVKNPINNYNIIPYIGKYVHFGENYSGENKRNLSLDYWVLDYNLSKAKKQFTQVKSMLKCFEYWFGPYPFYEDGYKLVESPHLGMEHQSAVAYGNKYANGYLGTDLSHTGWGLKWDYIIVHESGHEWFANSITTRDIADMWVHEGFTDYAETLYTECLFGKKAANEYCQGLRENIDNDIPIIGHYGVNQEGSGDMYYKGANMIHTIRQVINDDILFRNILRGLNKTFYHQAITSKQVEEYISKKSGKDLSKIFDQYLRTVNIPVLEYKISKNKIDFRWTNCEDGFNMPVKINTGKSQWITPAADWQSLKLPTTHDGETFSVDKNFYINTKKVN